MTINYKQDLSLKVTELGNRKVDIYEKESDGPVIFWMTFPFRNDETEHFLQCIEELLPEQSYVLVVCTVNDWNRDLSPWKAESPMGEKPFAGKGPETLKWLKETCVPSVLQGLGGTRKAYLIGYSLAGLFALWSAYEVNILNGIACCSGSLWFDAWDSFITQNRIKSQCNIYLSLGGKEVNTDNAVMATIGNAVRKQEKILKSDPEVKNVVLEMNPGGHFADSGKRLAKGVKWLISKEKGVKGTYLGDTS